MRIPRKENTGGAKGIHVAPRLPISLIPVEESKSKTDESMKFKLLSVPDKKGSPTFEMVLQPFCTGTPEEYIKTLSALDQVRKGQDLKDAKEKYVVARRFFLGLSLTTFDNASAKASSLPDQSDIGTETEENFKIVLIEVGCSVFSLNAYAVQKQEMRRFMRKTKEITFRSYVEHNLELNKYLQYFPVNPGDAKAAQMPSDDVMDILKFGVPNSCQNCMIELGFDAQALTTSEFIDLCQQISCGESNKEEGLMTQTKQVAGK